MKLSGMDGTVLQWNVSHWNVTLCRVHCVSGSGERSVAPLGHGYPLGASHLPVIALAKR